MAQVAGRRGEARRHYQSVLRHAAGSRLAGAEREQFVEAASEAVGVPYRWPLSPPVAAPAPVEAPVREPVTIWERREPVRVAAKAGANDPCPCGSGPASTSMLRQEGCLGRPGAAACWREEVDGTWQERKGAAAPRCDACRSI